MIMLLLRRLLLRRLLYQQQRRQRSLTTTSSRSRRNPSTSRATSTSPQSRRAQIRSMTAECNAPVERILTSYVQPPPQWSDRGGPAPADLLAAAEAAAKVPTPAANRYAQ